MTVAAFFRDTRVRSALAGSRPAAGSSILADFFAQFSIADIEFRPHFRDVFLRGRERFFRARQFPFRLSTSVRAAFAGAGNLSAFPG